MLIFKDGALHFGLPMTDLLEQPFVPQRTFVRMLRPDPNRQVAAGEFRTMCDAMVECVFVAFGIVFRSPWLVGDEEVVQRHFLHRAIEFQERMRCIFYYPGLDEAQYDAFLEDHIMSLCRDRVEAIGVLYAKSFFCVRS